MLGSIIRISAARKTRAAASDLHSLGIMPRPSKKPKNLSSKKAAIPVRALDFVM
jgi:hypothetical protein